LREELDAEPEAASRELFDRLSQPTQSSVLAAGVSRVTDPEGDGSPSLVVLPFVDVSTMPDPLRFATGLTDDLTGALTRIASLRVISRNTAYLYRRRRAGARQIAAELGVRYVLEGSVQRAGSSVRVNVRLVDAASDIQLWSERFDRNLEGVLLVQNDITEKVASVLRLEVLRAETRRLRTEPPPSLSAWTCAIAGWGELWTQQNTTASADRARQFVERALELDASNALAWAAQARVHFIDGIYPTAAARRAGYDPRKNFAQALAAAQQAVALDPSSAEAQVELSFALRTHCRYEESRLASEAAIRLNPSYEEAYLAQGLTIKAIGRPREAIDIIERSFAVAPVVPTEGRRMYFAAWAHLLAGQLDRALGYACRSRHADPTFGGPAWVRACVHGYRGEKDLAAQALGDLRELHREIATIESFVQQYRHVSGNDYAVEGLLRAGMSMR